MSGITDLVAKSVKDRFSFYHAWRAWRNWKVHKAD